MKHDFVGHVAKARESEKNKYNILNAIYFFTPKILMLGVMFVKIKPKAA